MWHEVQVFMCFCTQAGHKRLLAAAANTFTCDIRYHLCPGTLLCNVDNLLDQHGPCVPQLVSGYLTACSSLTWPVSTTIRLSKSLRTPKAGASSMWSWQRETTTPSQTGILIQRLNRCMTLPIDLLQLILQLHALQSAFA